MRGKAILLAALLVVSMVATAAMPAAAQPQANGTVSISGDPASDGSTYDYQINDESAVSNLSVELTGVDNVATQSTSGSLSSGSPQSVEVVSDKPPQNETITLSAPIENRSESVSGSVSYSGSETISPSGTFAVSDATVNLMGLETPSTYDNLDLDDGVISVSGGDTKTVTISNNNAGSVDSIELKTFADGTDVTVSVGGYTETITHGSESTTTYDVGGELVSSTFDIDITPSANINYDGLRVSYQSGNSVTVDGSAISPTGSTSVGLSKGSSNTIDFNDVGGSLDYSISWDETDGVGDISGSVGSTTIDQSGLLTSPVTRSVDISDGSNSIDLSYTGGSNALDYDLSWDETTQTRDPNVKINGNDVGVSGTLSDGESKQLSVSDGWIESGRNNVSVATNDPTDGPASVVGFEYQHEAGRTIDTSATSTQFESKYNVTHTYRNATEDATVILPFDSGRVIDIRTLEYRLNGGSWQSMDAADYTFNNSEITADISAATGGELSQDTTVDVRATGRKIDVENGAVTVTEPTAPGDELDTQLSIDSKSDDFQINVGPTVSGSRVHYGLSDDFGGTGPTGSAVIEANGDQHVQFPNSLPGDSVRMKHLRTQVKPQSGDVRIDVQEAGSDPKIDVSPGPGGAGDPVDIKYYRTQTGSEYILESLTQGIVLDSDTAESPAIFEDDDSDETWLIALGTVGGDGDTEEGEGIIGPVQQSTGIEIPFSGSVQPLLALLAIGALATVYFRGPDGFAYFSRAGGRAASATRSSIPIVGGLLGRLFGAIGTALSYGFGGLVRLAGFARSRPRLTAGVIGVASMAAVAFGVIPLPIELVFAAGVPLVSFVLLREIGQFNVTVWAVTSVAAFLGSLVALGVSFDGLINEQTSLILAVGGLYIAYQVVQVWRQGQITEVVVPGRGNDDDDE